MKRLYRGKGKSYRVQVMAHGLKAYTVEIVFQVK
jgi:hypothetical protein